TCLLVTRNALPCFGSIFLITRNPVPPFPHSFSTRTVAWTQVREMGELKALAPGKIHVPRKRRVRSPIPRNFIPNYLPLDLSRAWTPINPVYGRIHFTSF